jgi:tetratricopeptide (TPR) repeat protein
MGSMRFRPGRLLQPACLFILLLSGCRGQTEPDSLSLVALLKEGQFATLESGLVRYQLRFEADQGKPENQWPVYKAFFAFADSDPELQSRLDEWVAAMPDSYAAHLARGMFYEHLGWLSRGDAFAGETPKERFADMDRFFALAKPDLQKALAINPRLFAAYASKARMERASGNRKLMELALRAGLSVTPEAVPLHLTFLDGLEPRWGGSLGETRAYLESLVQDHPRIAALKWFGGYGDYIEGTALLMAGRYDEALARFDRALSFDDQYPYYRYGRAQALYMHARDSEAAQTLEPALAAEPQEPAFLEQMAKIRIQQLRSDDALATIGKALAFDPYNPDALRLRAQILAGVRRYAEAVRTLDDALVYGADDPRMLTERSDDLLNLSRIPDALVSARPATELAPHHSLAWLRYAESLFMSQDCKAKQALQAFRTVCRYDGMCGEEAKRSIPSMIATMPCQS